MTRNTALGTATDAAESAGFLWRLEQELLAPRACLAYPVAVLATALAALVRWWLASKIGPGIPPLHHLLADLFVAGPE